MLGHVAAGQIRVPAANCRQLAELRALLAPVPKIRRSRTQLVFILLGHGFPDRDNAIQMRERKRPQQHGIDRIENGRIRADAQRESNHRNRGEAGTLPQACAARNGISCNSPVIIDSSFSLVPQRHHGIDFGRAIGRNVTGHHRGHEKHNAHARESAASVGATPNSKLAIRRAVTKPPTTPNAIPTRASFRPLLTTILQQIAALRAQGHAQTKFARALRHAV